MRIATSRSVWAAVTQLTTDNGDLRFRTRNYKHEVMFNPASPRFVGNYTDEIWEAVCRHAAALGFNGLVLYGSARHPFQYILDYRAFPEAACQPVRVRNAVRASLRRGLAIAQRHGLTTYLQHYVTEFTPALAKHCGIRTTDRVAGIDHPQVDRYLRYCYGEIFRALPDLNGLYFNFESSGSAAEHVRRIAIPVLNRLRRPPVAVFRLWNFTEVDGLRRIRSEYCGRVIVCHKISDTNDVYYLPVADSRVREWKRLLPGLEWMFEIGPCHNCGTNLCDQLWADYDYVQQLLTDAVAKGADSISFHSVNEFAAPDLPAGTGPFSVRERTLAGFNMLHLQAVTDFFHRRRMTRSQRAAALARRVGVPVPAGRDLLDAITESSQLVLLAYQQFCYGSAADGYLHRGRHSHIQEPFFFYPATELNNQASRPMWNVGRPGHAWLDKRFDTEVAPENLLQYIIDFVDPSKSKAVRNPLRIAARMRRHMDEAQASWVRYRKSAGRDAADALAPYLRENAALGEVVRHEILAAIRLYRVYFAAGRARVLIDLKKGLAELRAAAALLADPADPVVKPLSRVLLLDRGPDVRPEVEGVSRLLRHLRRQDFPWEAFRLFVASRRLYNEVRRVILPGRQHDVRTITAAMRCLSPATAKARQALVLLEERRQPVLAQRVRDWLVFLESERKGVKPPEVVCAGRAVAAFLPLRHNHCFRRGESCMDDFLGFFEPMDYLRASGLSVRVYRTARELVVTLREDSADAADRPQRWELFKNDTSSTPFVMMVHLDPENQGAHAHTLIVWPKGVSVSIRRRNNVRARTAFSVGAGFWQTTVAIPFALLERPPPRRGEVWGFNITSNPFLAAQREYTWAPQYDTRNPKLFGKLLF